MNFQGIVKQNLTIIELEDNGFLLSVQRFGVAKLLFSSDAVGNNFITAAFSLSQTQGNVASYSFANRSPVLRFSVAFSMPVNVPNGVSVVHSSEEDEEDESE